MSNIKVAIVMLTWKRLDSLPRSLDMLSQQTNKDFTLYISNSNIPEMATVESHITPFIDKLNIILMHDSNDLYAFRRLFIARELAMQGFETILFLDDDVIIPINYVEQALSHFEPESFKSAYAWQFTQHGQNYYRRRFMVTNSSLRVDYCGTAVAMADAKLFLEDGLFLAPKEAYLIEDLWMCYYANHVLKWKLGYSPIEGVVIGGLDSVALSKTVKSKEHNKAVFLRDLVSRGWKL
jgi:hypothetical protein